MTFDGSLVEFLTDEITIEPFVSETGARAQTFGAPVTYKAQIQRGAKRVIGPQGREVISNIMVTIPERVHVDQRSRVTLPTGFVPLQPPIIGVEPQKGQGFDLTVLFL